MACQKGIRLQDKRARAMLARVYAENFLWDKTLPFREREAVFMRDGMAWYKAVLAHERHIEACDECSGRSVIQ